MTLWYIINLGKAGLATRQATQSLPKGRHTQAWPSERPLKTGHQKGHSSLATILVTQTWPPGWSLKPETRKATLAWPPGWLLKPGHQGRPLNLSLKFCHQPGHSSLVTKHSIQASQSWNPVSHLNLATMQARLAFRPNTEVWLQLGIGGGSTADQ